MGAVSAVSGQRKTVSTHSAPMTAAAASACAALMGLILVVADHQGKHLGDSGTCAAS